MWDDLFLNQKRGALVDVEYVADWLKGLLPAEWERVLVLDLIKRKILDSYHRESHNVYLRGAAFRDQFKAFMQDWEAAKAGQDAQKLADLGQAFETMEREYVLIERAEEANRKAVLALLHLFAKDK
jgi:hypothetical protein